MSVSTATRLAAVGTLVLAGAALVALLSLRDARRTRHAIIVDDLTKRWDEQLASESRELHYAYDTARAVALTKTFYTGNPSEDEVATWFALQRWLELIETIGVLHSERAISSRVLFKLWGPSIAGAWKKWKEPILLMRKEEKAPGIYKQLERLARKMERRLWWEKARLWLWSYDGVS